MQKTKIRNPLMFSIYLRREEIFILQSNYKCLNEICFNTYRDKEGVDLGEFAVAGFRVKQTSKPISERLRQSKYIRAKSIMEIADEIIFEALKNEAA